MVCVSLALLPQPPLEGTPMIENFRHLYRTDRKWLMGVLGAATCATVSWTSLVLFVVDMKGM